LRHTWPQAELQLGGKPNPKPVMAGSRARYKYAVKLRLVRLVGDPTGT
jgi:hypothetical protein